MKVTIEFELFIDGLDEAPLEEQINAVRILLDSGAESINADVNILDVIEIG